MPLVLNLLSRTDWWICSGRQIDRHNQAACSMPAPMYGRDILCDRLLCRRKSHALQALHSPLY